MNIKQNRPIKYYKQTISISLLTTMMIFGFQNCSKISDSITDINTSVSDQKMNDIEMPDCVVDSKTNQCHKIPISQLLLSFSSVQDQVVEKIGNSNTISAQNLLVTNFSNIDQTTGLGMIRMITGDGSKVCDYNVGLTFQSYHSDLVPLSILTEKMNAIKGEILIDIEHVHTIKGNCSHILNSEIPFLYYVDSNKGSGSMLCVIPSIDNILDVNLMNELCSGRKELQTLNENPLIQKIDLKNTAPIISRIEFNGMGSLYNVQKIHPTEKLKWSSNFGALWKSDKGDRLDMRSFSKEKIAMGEVIDDRGCRLDVNAGGNDFAGHIVFAAQDSSCSMLNGTFIYSLSEDKLKLTLRRPLDVKETIYTRLE